MNKATTIIVDLESVPSQAEGAPERALQNLKVPATHKKPETIAKWLEENADKAYRDTALDGGYGEAIIIGYAFDDQEPQALVRMHDMGGEAEMLQDFWNLVSANASAVTTWVGHNITWDLLFLFRRSKVLGVDVPPVLPLAPSPWSPQVADTSYLWTWDRNRRISLAELASILGIEAKTAGITGADVWDYAQEGRYDELVAYCKEDVSVTRQVYERLLPVW